jgi:transcriptional regulator with XRE-family HTH domain
MTLGDRIRQLLRDRNWSQAQLAQASGLDPSVLSRALGAERPWRKEHVACVAAALSKTPAELIADTDANLPTTDSDIDAEFVSTLTRAHGALVAENSRCSEEVAALRRQLDRLDDEGRKRDLLYEEVRLELEREKRMRSTAETEKRASGTREALLVREVGTLKSLCASLRAELDSTRAQLSHAQTSYSQAVELVNRNYVVAKDLERRLSATTGVATVTGILGLAMLVGSSQNEQPKKRRRRATGA